MKQFLLILFIFTAITSHASAPDFRICDNDSDCLDVTPEGNLTHGALEASTGSPKNSPDYRVCDNDGDCLDINEDGSINGTST